jgi:di/tricarboxylate transporter
MAVLSPEQKLVQRDKEMIPRRLLRAMLALVVVVLLIVTWARLTDRPLTAMPPSDIPSCATSRSYWWAACPARHGSTTSMAH